MKIEFTEDAKQKVLSYLEGQTGEGHLLRIRVAGQGATGFNYQFFLDEEKDKQDGDLIEEMEAFRLIVDGDSAKLLEGSTVDWVDTSTGAGFKVNNPNQSGPDLKDPVAKKVQELLNNEINPSLANHGGFVTLLDVKDGRVFVQMGGGCHGCGMARVTLKQGVEVRIKEAIPEITEVVDSTDHAEGNNPYYQG